MFLKLSCPWPFLCLVSAKHCFLWGCSHKEGTFQRACRHLAGILGFDVVQLLVPAAPQALGLGSIGTFLGIQVRSGLSSVLPRDEPCLPRGSPWRASFHTLSIREPEASCCSHVCPSWQREMKVVLGPRKSGVTPDPAEFPPGPS